MHPEDLRPASAERRAFELRTKLQGKIGQRILINGDTLGTIVSEDFILTEDGVELPMIGYARLKGNSTNYVEGNLRVSFGDYIVRDSYGFRLPNAFVFVGNEEIDRLKKNNNHTLNSQIGILESALMQAESNT